jgi:hypothetical protein
MAREFTDHISIADIEKGGKKAELRLGEAHESLLRQASEFAGTHQLNIYKKSRLANRVKWALLDAGYPKPLVDDLAYKLATAVTLAGKK